AYIFVLIFTTIVFVGVEGALIALMVKYRRGKRARSADGLQLHGSTRLEILWTVVPVLILAAIGAVVFIKLPPSADAPAGAPPDLAQQSVTAADGQLYPMSPLPHGPAGMGCTAAPADNVVNEDVFAPDNDVLHSWWVPELGGKIDAIPGRPNYTWFKAPAGIYPGRCSDLCGIQHTMMLATVEVKPRAEYEQFIDE